MRKIIEHSFNIEEAKEYGIEKAILLKHIRFWLAHNKANNANIYEYKGDNPKYQGRKFIWTFNSSTAFAELFPYMNERSIRRWLKELEEKGILLSSKEYNKNKYDKTKWYTIPDEFEIGQDKMDNSLTENVRSIGQNDQSEGHNDQPIPDINTNINTNVNKYIGQTKFDRHHFEELFNQFWSEYPRKVAKTKAKDKFIKILKEAKNPDKLFTDILSGLQKYKKTKQWKDKQFIPHPTTWLNQRRWEDEIDDLIDNSKPRKFIIK